VDNIIPRRSEQAESILLEILAAFAAMAGCAAAIATFTAPISLLALLS
jgi:hypothetical protein